MQIKKLEAEKEELLKEYWSFEQPMVDKTGYESCQLIRKIVEPYMIENPDTKEMIRKTDAKGNPLSKTTYEAIYPKEQNYLPLTLCEENSDECCDTPMMQDMKLMEDAEADTRNSEDMFA